MEILNVCSISFIPCSENRLPFDWTNPVGYLIAFSLEYAIFSYEYFVITCTLALCVGSYCFAIAMTKELKRILNSINVEAHDNQSKELQTLFSEFIYTHGNVKQLSTLPIFSSSD